MFFPSATDSPLTSKRGAVQLTIRAGSTTGFSGGLAGSGRPVATPADSTRDEGEPQTAGQASQPRLPQEGTARSTVAT